MKESSQEIVAIISILLVLMGVGYFLFHVKTGFTIILGSLVIGLFWHQPLLDF